uniref:ATP synthase subunit a n=1 Tax=Scelimena melli TaxID=215044 RepID=A0A8F5GF35_9ORTH|nr:ATP synthase F0 subunit 6 [Scelimena melli]
MMTNLFSSFDPTTSWNFSINWLSSLMFLTIMPLSFWGLKTRSAALLNSAIKNLNKEFNSLLMEKNTNTTLIFISLFMLILINNTLGLFPYVFTSTSHMSMTLTMALPLWLSFNLFGWINKTNHMFEHMVPMGTPGILMPFMVCIETISNLIRPMTLAIRLAANMIAGHLLMTLMGNTGTHLSNMLLMSMLAVQIILITLETAVSMIQAYVFSVLSTLYSSEVN